MKRKPHNRKPHQEPESEIRNIGYARVSTEEQNLDMQLRALRAAGVEEDNLHYEKVSAQSNKREKLDEAIKQLRPGDTFIVWKLDRLARGPQEFYIRLGQIRDQGAKLKSLQEPFEFETATGEFMLNILVAGARLEVALTADRTKAGLKAYVARGGKLGPKPKLTPESLAQILLHLNGKGVKKMTVLELAAKFKVKPPTIYRYFALDKSGKKPIYVRKAGT